MIRLNNPNVTPTKRKTSERSKPIACIWFCLHTAKDCKENTHVQLATTCNKLALLDRAKHALSEAKAHKVSPTILLGFQRKHLVAGQHNIWLMDFLVPLIKAIIIAAPKSTDHLTITQRIESSFSLLLLIFERLSVHVRDLCSYNSESGWVRFWGFTPHRAWKQRIKH